MGAKSHCCERYEPDVGRGGAPLAEQLQIEAERRADNYAAAVAEYQKKKAEAALRQAQKQEATQRHGVSEEMIASIGAQLRDCRIFVSDDVVRSVADGARVRHGGGLLAADNGRLREVKVWRAGEKDKKSASAFLYII